MTRLTAHLVRGATAAILIAWALFFAGTQPALALVSGAVAVIAMRGTDCRHVRVQKRPAIAPSSDSHGEAD